MINSSAKILVIKSDISKLAKVQHFVNEIFVLNSIPHKNFNKVFICISEAVINSIQHGNKNDLNKEVSILVDYISKSLKVKISDEGDGFNLGEIEDPTCIENIKKEAGRGLYIIKSLSDKIEYIHSEKSIQFKISLSE